MQSITVKTLLSTLLLVITALPIAHAQSQPEKPNIVVIIADDLMKQVEFYGHQTIKTPALNTLAQESMIFNRAYAQYPLCGPSRASMMLSQFPSNSGITWNQGGKSKSVQKKAESLGIDTMPAHFRKNGYVTVGGGKLYHDSVIENSDSAKHDFTVALGSKGKDGKKVKDKTTGKKLTEIVQASDYGDYEHKDGALVKNAKNWLSEYTSQKNPQPFFMAIGLKKPHSPFAAPKRFFDMYQRDAMQISEIKPPKNILNHYSLSKSSALLKVHADTNQYNAYTLPDAKKKEIMHGYSACVSYMDFLVGDLVATLKAEGLYDNTIILFTSDHGYKLGEYDRWAKFTLMEKDTTVPLMVRVPQFKATHGTQSNAIVGLIDLYPTLAELSDISVPKQLDGISFVNSLKNADTPARDYIHTVVSRSKITTDDGKLQPNASGASIINAQGYRYTHWWQGKTNELPQVNDIIGAELYDHYGEQNTVISTKNIIAEKPELAKKMLEQALKLK